MSEQTQALATTEQRPSQSIARFSAFSSIECFENAQRMAKLLMECSFIPDRYKGKVADCVVAMEMANRIGANVLAVMQNMYIVHGQPAWSSQFLIATLNASKRFSPLRYRMTGQANTDSWGCVAWAKDIEDGQELLSPEVTIKMAKAEGWMQKNGSKWVTMPELMLRYRAATFFARQFAPEIAMGIRTEEEIIDIGPGVVDHEIKPAKLLATVPKPVTATVTVAPAVPAAKATPAPAVVEKPANVVTMPPLQQVPPQSSENAPANDQAQSEPPFEADELTGLQKAVAAAMKANDITFEQFRDNCALKGSAKWTGYQDIPATMGQLAEAKQMDFVVNRIKASIAPKDPKASTPQVGTNTATAAATPTESVTSDSTAGSSSVAAAAPSDDHVESIGRKCADFGITEPQVCKWLVTTYKLSPSESLTEINEMAPRRVKDLNTDFRKHATAIKAIK